MEYVLEGTVRWASDASREKRVRITPQLIRVADDTNLWAQSYDRRIDDIFQIQSGIAGEVVNLLAGTERALPVATPTSNVDAYDAYLRGLFHHFAARLALSKEEGERGIEFFARAVELDPNFALAYSYLAIAHSGHFHFGHDRTSKRQEMARQAVERALELAPESTETHLAVGFYYYWARKDYPNALQAFTLASENRRDYAVYIGWVQRRQGRLEEALARLEEAAELNPQDKIMALDLGHTNMALRRYPEAIRHFDWLITLAPDQGRGYRNKANVYWLWSGDRRWRDKPWSGR